MHKFVRNLLTEWRKLKLPFADETIIVAVSGGADSVSLILALKDLVERKKVRNCFIIAHFDHNLRGEESLKDAEFVGKLAGKLGFKFVLGISDSKFEIPKTGNLEQNARIARYRFLIETAENENAYGIITAHTMNDQAETFLLNLIRGSGIAGLSAIKPITMNYELEVKNSNPQAYSQNSKSEIALIRPFLNWARREDTEKFCFENKIEVRNDEMNEDLKFKRVLIRKKLLPLLKEFNPKIVENLAKTSRLLADQIELSEQVEMVEASDYLLLKDLRSLSKSVLYQTMRDWLKNKRGNLSGLELKHIEAIERLIRSGKSGRVIELPNGEMVEKKSGKLIFQKR